MSDRKNVQKLANGRYRVQWRDRGERDSECFPNKALAQKFKARLLLEKYDPDARVNQLSLMYFEDFALGKWLLDYCHFEKSETQWASDEDAIKRYLIPEFGKKQLHELSKADLEDLKTTMRRVRLGQKKRPLKPKSINNVLLLAKAILSKAVDWGFLAENPFSSVKQVEVLEQPFDFWTIEERDYFIHFAKVIDPDFTDIVEVACNTGLRLGELAGLKRSELDFNQRMIRVRYNYNFKLGKELGRTKNKKIGSVPMNEAVYAILMKHKDKAPAADIFSKCLLRNAIHRLRSLCHKVDVKSIRFHDLRHTFASCLAMAGVDLRTIQILMRHSSIQMTMRYAHLHPDYLKGATEVLCRGTILAQSIKKSPEAATSELI